jgi:hypothetical protein
MARWYALRQASPQSASPGALQWLPSLAIPTKLSFLTFDSEIVQVSSQVLFNLRYPRPAAGPKSIAFMATLIEMKEKLSTAASTPGSVTVLTVHLTRFGCTIVTVLQIGIYGHAPNAIRNAVASTC